MQIAPLLSVYTIWTEKSTIILEIFVNSWYNGKNASGGRNKSWEIIMTEEKIKRINELAHKSKSEGLTEEEKAEQTALRNEYRQAVVGNLRAELNNTYIMTPDGKKRKVGKK